MIRYLYFTRPLLFAMGRAAPDYLFPCFWYANVPIRTEFPGSHANVSTGKGNPIGHANVPIGKCQYLTGHANVPVEKCNPLFTQMCQMGSANLWTTSTGQPGSGNVFEASMPSLVEAYTSGDTTQVGVCDPNGRVDQGGHQLNVCETNNNEPTTPRSIVGSVVNFDPQSMPTEDEFTFEAHTSINEYLEKHEVYAKQRKPDPDAQGAPGP